MATPDLHWCVLDDGAVPWVDLGGSRDPVVVAIPGLSDGLMPLSEARTRRALAAVPHHSVPFRVLVLSHRHPVPAGTTTRDLADDVATFVRDVVGEPVAVIGHSMGGMVAQWLAARYPDLVTHLALTATLSRPDDAFRTVLRRWEAAVRRGAWRAFYADANATSYSGSELLRRRLLLRLSRAVAVPHLVDRHRRLTQACLTHDTTGELATISVPTLVLAGAADPVVSPAAARAVADAIPGARFEVFEGLRHGFPEQSPTRTYRAVAALMGVDRGGSRP